MLVAPAVDSDDPADRLRRWLRSDSSDRLLWFVVVPVVIAVVLGGAFALLPGQLVFLSSWGGTAGLSDCALEQGSLLLARCGEIGYPVGQVSFEAMLPRTLSHWIGLLPGIGPYSGFQLTGLAFLALGAAGCIALVRDLTDRYWPGAIAAVAYLSSPVTLLEPGLPQVWLGIFLLPAALWVLLRLARLAWTWRNLVAMVLGSAVTAWLLLNTSGYSYLHLLTLTTVIGGSWALFSPRPDRLPSLGGIAAVLFSAGVAGLLHRELYWPTAAVAQGAPLEFFRGASLDLAAMAAPSADNHLWGPLGAPWGELETGAAVFLGWTALALAVVGVVALARRRPRAAVGTAAAIVVAGTLALGPSLRVDDPWPPDGQEPGSYNARLMPAEAARFDFPWAQAYTMPPLDLARVVRRWSIPLHLAIDLAAAVGLAHVAGRQKRRPLAVAAAAVLATGLLVESADPALPGRLSTYDGRLDWTVAFTDEVIEPLDAALPDDAVVLFLPRANDYLATAVGPLADLRLINVSGDKNVANVRAQQDPATLDALRGYARDEDTWEESMQDLIEAGTLDAVVLGEFSLRWASYRWPPSETATAELAERHTPAVARFDQLGCTTERFPRGWVVTCGDG